MGKKVFIRKPHKPLLVIGLMSGTSHDGIDAALVKISHDLQKINLLQHIAVPFSKTLRAQIAAAFSGTTETICCLNFLLGEEFAKAALKLIAHAKLTPAQITAIASHGQTIYHIPPSKNKPGATLQIGEAAIIAERTGILTISNFRERDIAAGGQGAPLVPFADWLLFHEPNKVTAVQNIGGIANVTVVPNKREEVIAFDTGPGNALIDEVVKLITNGKAHYDKNGLIARQGKVDQALLQILMQHTYLKQKPPKSTGRELFGKTMALQLVTEYENNISDLVATLTKFTAASIAAAYRRFILPHYKITQMIVTGGGSKNPVLMQFLREEFSPAITIIAIDSFKIPSAAKEALSFALLGAATLLGVPCNIPSATGANKPVILGKISLP